MDELQRHYAGSFLPDAEQLSRDWFERSTAPAAAGLPGYAGAFRGHRRTAQRSGAGLPAGFTGRAASAPDSDSTKLARWPEFYLLGHAARALGAPWRAYFRAPRRGFFNRDWCSFPDLRLGL